MLNKDIRNFNCEIAEHNFYRLCLAFLVVLFFCDAVVKRGVDRWFMPIHTYLRLEKRSPKLGGTTF